MFISYLNFHILLVPFGRVPFGFFQVINTREPSAKGQPEVWFSSLGVYDNVRF